MDKNRCLFPISIISFFSLCTILLFKEKVPIRYQQSLQKPSVSSSLWPQMTYEDFNLFVSTIWAEARGEQYKGMCAVAEVILNRFRKCKTEKLSDIILKDKQFSCWNVTDPNFKYLSDFSYDKSSYMLAQKAAIEALSGSVHAKGATHYHAHHINPSWSEGKKPLLSLGGHKFYRLKS